jgi:predicted membrane protein
MTLIDKPADVAVPEERTPRRRGRSQFVVGGILLLVGGLWLLERLDWIDLTVTAVLAIATALIGVALMVLSREGSHPGLIVMGTVLGLLALVTAAAPFEGFQGEFGDRNVIIDNADDIGASYSVAMGTLTIDLSQIGEMTSSRHLSAAVGTGELLILVPEDIHVVVDARMGAGQIVLFDETVDGVGLDRSYETAGLDGMSQLVLDLEVFAGRLEVDHG